MKCKQYIVGEMSYVILRIRRPPKSTLLPYAPLFQSAGDAADHVRARAVVHEPGAAPLEDRRDHRGARRSEEHTSELQSRQYLVCRLLLEKNTKTHRTTNTTDVKHYVRYIHTLIYYTL